MSLEQLTEIEGLQAAADLGQSTVTLLYQKLSEATGESNLIAACIEKLENYITAVQKQEAKILDLFKVKDEAALRAKFQNYYNKSGLINLTGSELDRTILEAYRQSNRQDLKEMQIYIDKYIKPAMLESAKESFNGDRNKIASAFNDVLNNWSLVIDLNTGNSKVSSGKPISTSSFSKEWDILASKLTKAQERRIKALMKQAPQGIFKNKININSIIGNFQAQIKLEIGWADITGRLSPSEAKKLSPEKLNEINNKVTNFILGKINSGYRDIARKYINRMLGIDQTMFFVGKNVNDITGIVGEISAMIAIGELMPGLDRNKIMTWVGNHKVNNRKLSIDIILKDIGGIQVKNTSIDAESVPNIDINFAQGTATTILQRLFSNYSIDVDSLVTVFESEAFNVPAILEGTKMVETSLGVWYHHGKNRWSEFVNAYNCMQSVINWTHQLMTANAPDFLYMSGGSTFQNQLANLDRWCDRTYNNDGYMDIMGGGGNVLYIVGTKPFLMSSILKIIQEDLKKLIYIKDEAANFSLQASLGTYLEGKQKVPYNYVAYVNSHDSFESIKGRKVKLTSSMIFQK